MISDKKFIVDPGTLDGSPWDDAPVPATGKRYRRLQGGLGGHHTSISV